MQPNPRLCGIAIHARTRLTIAKVVLGTTRYTRSDLTVELSYYVPNFPVDNAVMELVSRNGRTLLKLTGDVCWHPVMKTKKNQYGGFNADSYPHYVYIRVNGIIEIVKHVQGPTFRVKDDPVLFKGALEAKRCDKG
jgi:hypothetical protein